MKSLYLILSGSLLFCQACRPDADPEPSGTVRIEFDQMVGTQDLVLDSQSYRNGSGEAFTVSTLNYYISNIRLNRADGSSYVVPQDSSYFLIQESRKESQTITLRHVPEGDYTDLTFMVGVDSLRSTMDNSRRTGVLDPATGHQGMYWEWNSGYIFLKLEGSSPTAPVDATGKNRFTYHIGLFGGYRTRTLNNTRVVTLPFGANRLMVSDEQVPRVVVQADVLKCFDGPNTVSIARNPTVMIAPFSASIADNYARMFSVRAIQSQ